MRQLSRPEAESLQPRLPPLQQQPGELLGGAGEDMGVRVELGAVEVVQPGLPAGRVAGVEEDHQIGEDPQRRLGASDGRLRRPDALDDRGGVLPVARGDVHDVGRAGRELVRQRVVGQGGDQRLALRGARGDRGALHTEPLAA
ncbi:hypothetical protein Misp03_79070 [Microbispora sp. NBRC 16548]|nr:hypothetical protein Misp03_79070 [Microbispora sp. NBRC 16548]